MYRIYRWLVDANNAVKTSIKNNGEQLIRLTEYSAAVCFFLHLEEQRILIFGLNVALRFLIKRIIDK